MNKLVAEGKTLEQVQAAKPTADYDSKWGNGFLKIQPWVDMVYQGVKRKQAGAFNDASNHPHAH